MGERSIDIELWQGAVHDNITRVQSALAKGAYIDTLGPDGGTPLRSLLRFSGVRFNVNGIQPSNQTVLFLLKNGADPNRQDTRGRAAIHECSIYGNLEHLKLLVEYKADVNLKTETGRTPLHMCAKSGNVDFAEFLILHGAHINSLDNDHRTPLMAAVVGNTPEGNVEMVTCLIVNNANMLLRGVDGQTAESLSIDLDHGDITEVIQAAILIREKCIAFASGHQERLGSESLVKLFEPEVMRMILEKVLQGNI